MSVSGTHCHPHVCALTHALVSLNADWLAPGAHGSQQLPGFLC